ncbi:sialoadhesin-like [Misgurnus anguillicaudatus]|uniref:sialoadhesin-like n=1 Tax=Misgurnus anguillicaudatus TaxID=75329 RepID=UPI003CCF1114
MNLLLHLLFQGVLLYETFAWEVRMPKEIHGLKGSCLVVPCSFYYRSYPPSNPNRVVWYQWVSTMNYPLVYDPWYPNDVIGKFRRKTDLYGNPSKWSCSLLIKTLDLSHQGEKIYAWIDPENVGRSTYRFFDVTSTIRVDTDPPQPNITIYGGEKTGDRIIVTCFTFHTCPYSKPNIVLKGIDGSDKVDDSEIKNGLWKTIRTRTGYVKAERSDIECTVTHYGGRTTTATKNKNSACIPYSINIEPKLADVTEGVAKDFNCTVHHSCQTPPIISWNYEDMPVKMGIKQPKGFKLVTIIFLGAKTDDGKKLICTAKFSGQDITASIDLHVKQYEPKIVNITDIEKNYVQADVAPKITALYRSCVVIPCTFNMEDELAAQLRARWVSKKGYMYHTGPRRILDNFRGRTRLIGNPDEQNCTVEIDDVKPHDNGPFCFQAEKDEVKYKFNESCVFILIRAQPDNPVVSSLPENIKPGARVTIKCTVKHTCPSHPPSITWSIKTARETVSHRSVSGGVWETVSTVTFIPTGYEEMDEIVCNAKFWGDKVKMVNGSTELSVKRIQGVGMEIYGPCVIAPVLLILLLCAAVIIFMKRRSSRMSEGRAVWNNSRGDADYNRDVKFF